LSIYQKFTLTSSLGVGQFAVTPDYHPLGHTFGNHLGNRESYKELREIC